MSTDDKQSNDNQIEADPESGEEEDVAGGDGVQPRTLLAILATLAVVVVIAIAVLADQGGDGGESPQPTATLQVVDNAGGEAGIGGESGDVELGSLSVTAYACPEASSPDSDCLEAGMVELSGAVFVLEDGAEVGIDAATDMPDGSIAWLNVPVGEYQLPRESLSGPAGMTPRNVVGSVEPSEGGWTVSNLDPNQPAVVQILFVPEDGSPAAG